MAGRLLKKPLRAQYILIIGVTLGLLAGCGQKGPLYFPEPEDSEREQKDDDA